MNGYEIRQEKVDDFKKLCSGVNAMEFSLFFGNEKHGFFGCAAWVVDGSREWSASFGHDEPVAKFDGKLPLKAVMAAIIAMRNAI